MTYKPRNNYKPNNNLKTNSPNDMKYKPSLFGTVVMCIAAPSAIIGVISIVLALVTGAASGLFFTISLVSEGIAFIGGILIVVDIVIFNKKNELHMVMTGQTNPKEKDMANIIHLVVGLGLGVLLGYLIWGIK